MPTDRDPPAVSGEAGRVDAARPGRHVLYALPRLGRLPYHLPTIVALADRGARVTVVFCKPERRKASRTARGRGLVAWVDDLARDRDDVVFREEGKETRIRASYHPRPHRDRLRMLRSYAYYLRRFGRANPYSRRWRGYLPGRLRRLVGFRPVEALLKTDSAFALLTAAEGLLRPDPGITAWLTANAVDVVVASPTNQGRHAPDAEFVKAANACGVPTALPVASWDNLSTKGLIPCPPTLFLAWNRSHAREAVGVHGLGPDSVVITGAPFFDKWFDRPAPAAREAFLQARELPRTARYLLYLGSSRMIAADEGWIVEEIREAMNRDPSLRELTLIVRPHPSNTDWVERPAALDGVCADESALPYSDEMQGDFVDLVAHAEAFVGVNTSGMVDALVLGGAGFTILTERYRATQSESVHFRQLVDTDALYVERDIAAFGERLARFAAGDDPKAAARRRFVAEFVRPRGVEVGAGVRQAQAILMLAEGRSPREIDRALDGGGQAADAAAGPERPVRVRSVGG